MISSTTFNVSFVVINERVDLLGRWHSDTVVIESTSRIVVLPYREGAHKLSIYKGKDHLLDYRLDLAKQ